MKIPANGFTHAGKFHADDVFATALLQICLLYTSDAADEEDSVDLGGRRIIKKKNDKEKKEESKQKADARDRLQKQEN